MLVTYSTDVSYPGLSPPPFISNLADARSKPPPSSHRAVHHHRRRVHHWNVLGEVFVHPLWDECARPKPNESSCILYPAAPPPSVVAWPWLGAEPALLSRVGSCAAWFCATKPVGWAHDGALLLLCTNGSSSGQGGHELLQNRPR